jgi:hypothetical protein
MGSKTGGVLEFVEPSKDKQFIYKENERNILVR